MVLNTVWDLLQRDFSRGSGGINDSFNCSLHIWTFYNKSKNFLKWRLLHTLVNEVIWTDDFDISFQRVLEWSFNMA